MSAVHSIPSAPPTMPAVARIMARYDREKLAAFISVAIDLLDTLDGDSDLEEDNEDRCNAYDDNPTEDHISQGMDAGYAAGDPDDAEEDDNDCGVDDGMEAVEEREPEDYEGGHSDRGVSNPLGMTA